MVNFVFSAVISIIVKTRKFYLRAPLMVANKSNFCISLLLDFIGRIQIENRCIATLKAHKLVVMTATAAMRRVRAGTRAPALLCGSIVLQLFVSHLESREVIRC